MSVIILDGQGRGNTVGVTDGNQLKTVSVASSIQHSVSHTQGQAYQLIGVASLSSGTVVPLHLKNISTTLDIIVTYVRHQVLDEAGGTAFPNASNYFRIAYGRTYSSGGTTITPVQLNTGSSNIAQVTAYQGATLAGTATDFDRWYTKAEGDMNSFNKEGSVIIAPGDTIELSYVGDQSSGTIYTRLSFIMQSAD